MYQFRRETASDVLWRQKFMFAKVGRMNRVCPGLVLALILLLFSVSPGARAQSWTWTNQVIDVEGDDSWIVVDHNGNLHVSYRHPTGAQLKYAFQPASGKRWFNTTLDDMQGDFQTRIAVNDQGNPYICYTPKTLKFAYFDGQRWTRQQIDPGIGTVNYYCSVRVGRDGNPQVSWYVESGVYLRYAVLRDGAWEAMNIDAQNTPGKFNSLILDANGNP